MYRIRKQLDKKDKEQIAENLDNKKSLKQKKKIKN